MFCPRDPVDLLTLYQVVGDVVLASASFPVNKPQSEASIRQTASKCGLRLLEGGKSGRESCLQRVKFEFRFISGTSCFPPSASDPARAGNPILTVRE